MSELDRRTFLRGVAGAAAGLSAAQALASADLLTAASRRIARPVSGGRFRQGVASGEPTPHEMTLWTKLDEVDQGGLLTLEVARDPGFDRVVERRRVAARHASEFAVKARVHGLEPDERYWYRFETRAHHSPVGTFKTLPPRDSRRPIRIGIFSCQDFVPGYYTAHAGLLDEPDLDLLVCLGDYIYERKFYEPEIRQDTTGANGDGEVQTLGEYRDKYALYHTDANLLELRRKAPLIATWDDHEVEDNYTGKLPGDATMDRRIDFARRRRNAYRAFFEHMPFGPGGHREGDRLRVYRSIRLGHHAELVLLDERKYRDDQPCDDGAPPIPPCPDAELNDPSRTFLGRRQKRWLKNQLRRSDATWKLVGNPLMMMALEFPVTAPFIMDGWDGYAAERTEVLSYIRDRRIKNVSFLTGDIHTFFAGDLSPTGRQNLLGQPAAVATEFVAGSVTSLGIPETINATTGVPLPKELIVLLADTAALKLNNPHMAYTNSDKRGYAVVEARGDELNVTYRAPATTATPQSPVSTLKRFVVKAGTPKVELV